MANGETQSSYQFESVLFFADRSPDSIPVDIKNSISDLEIFEHIEKPYLTGQIAFIDNNNLIAAMDVQGGERIVVNIRPTNLEERAKIITKTFRIEKIIGSYKANDKNETIFLKLVEDIVYTSSVKNINKSYQGTPISIMANILSTFLKKEVVSSIDEYKGKMKVIVPNLHPIEAALWIRNRTTSSDGLPFYVYSSFGDEFLRIVDLGTMLRSRPINIKNPYVYWQNAANTLESFTTFTSIQNYRQEENENLLRLIRSGVVGSKYSFYDTMKAIPQDVNFAVDNDVFYTLAGSDYFKEGQERFNYGPDFKIEEKKISEYNSRVISHITNGGTYDGAGGFKTLHQEPDGPSHKKKVIANSLRNFMTKAPMVIQVRGQDFITHEENVSGYSHYTTGNVIRILFKDNSSDDPDEPRFDRRKSGDYIIYAARHMIKAERYDVSLLCAKLASFVEEPSIQ